MILLASVYSLCINISEYFRSTGVVPEQEGQVSETGADESAETGGQQQQQHWGRRRGLEGVQKGRKASGQPEKGDETGTSRTGGRYQAAPRYVSCLIKARIKRQ